MPGNGKTTSGIWIAANLAALALLPCDDLDDGTPVWVVSERCTYTFLASSSLTVDGFEVVIPIVGSPRAGNAGAQYVRSAASAQRYAVTTTDASVTPYVSIAFPQNSTIQVEVIVNATQTNGVKDHAAIRAVFGFATNSTIAGPLGAGIVPIVDLRDAGAALWSISANLSGLMAQMTVQGEVGKMIVWNITVVTTIN